MNIVYHEVTIPLVVTRLKSISQTFDVVMSQEYVALTKCNLATHGLCLFGQDS